MTMITSLTLWCLNTEKSYVYYNKLKVDTKINLIYSACANIIASMTDQWTLIKISLTCVCNQVAVMIQKCMDDALVLIFIKQQMSTEIDTEDAIKEFKVFIPGKRRFEL